MTNQHIADCPPLGGGDDTHWASASIPGRALMPERAAPANEDVPAFIAVVTLRFPKVQILVYNIFIKSISKNFLGLDDMMQSEDSR